MIENLGLVRLVHPDIRQELRERQRFSRIEVRNLGLDTADLGNKYVRVGNRYYVPDTNVGNDLQFSTDWVGRPEPLCTACIPGKFKPEPGNDLCSGCPAGQYYDDAAEICEACPPGTFNPDGDALGLASCTACPRGTFNPNTAQTSSDACQPCPAGAYGRKTGAQNETDGCALCPLGKFSDTVGAEYSITCEACAAGVYGVIPGATTADTACDPCRAGTFSSQIAATSADTCTPCAAGTFSTATAATSSSTCEACPAGTRQPVEGAAASSACVPCAAGTFSTLPGFAGASCTPCPAGTFLPVVGASSVDSCQQCPTGKFQPNLGAVLPSNCSACPPGTYGDAPGAATSSACQACRAGTFSATPAAGSSDTCQTCPAGTFSTSTGQTSAATCTECPAGTYGPLAGADALNDCQLCPRKTYQPRTGRDELSDCLNCPEGTSQDNIGVTSADLCLACPAGKYAIGAIATLDECTVCPADYFCEGGRQLERCTPDASSPAGSTDRTQCRCDPGFSGDHDRRCTPCLDGYRKPEPGPAPCAACPADFYCLDAISDPVPCPEHAQSASGSSALGDCKCGNGFQATGNASLGILVCEECASASACREPIPVSTVSFEFGGGDDSGGGAPSAPPTTEELEQARLDFAGELNTDAENVAIESVTNEVAVSLPIADTATVALSDLNEMAAADPRVEDVSLSIQTGTNIYVQPGEPDYEVKREELMQEAREELCDTLVGQGFCACGRETSNGCPEGTVRVGAGTATDRVPGDASVTFDFALDVSEYTGDEALGPATFAASDGRLQNNNVNINDIFFRIEQPQDMQTWIDTLGFDLQELDGCASIDIPCQATKTNRRRYRRLLQSETIVYLLRNGTDPDFDLCLITIQEGGKTYLAASAPILADLDLNAKIDQCIPLELDEDTDPNTVIGQAGVPTQTWQGFSLAVDIVTAVDTDTVPSTSAEQDELGDEIKTALQAAATAAGLGPALDAVVPTTTVRAVAFEIQGVAQDTITAAADDVAQNLPGAVVQDVVQVFVEDLSCPPGQQRAADNSGCVCNPGTRTKLSEPGQ